MFQMWNMFRVLKMTKGLTTLFIIIIDLLILNIFAYLLQKYLGFKNEN